MVSFEQNIIIKIVEGAKNYKKTFIDTDYLIYSTSFSSTNYYEIKSKSSNFLHLTGLETHLKKTKFFQKCINGDLTTSDFSVHNKQSVRRKVSALPSLQDIFSMSQILFEENYNKNNITCRLAVENSSVVIGFGPDASKPLSPITLLNKTKLNPKNVIPLNFILSKPTGTAKYNSIVQGSIDEVKIANDIHYLISENLLTK